MRPALFLSLSGRTVCPRPVQFLIAMKLRGDIQTRFGGIWPARLDDGQVSRIDPRTTPTANGVEPGAVDRIFNPMFTTKEHGMGMGYRSAGRLSGRGSQQPVLIWPRHRLRTSADPNRPDSLANLALEGTADMLRRDGTDELVHDPAVAADNERLRNTIDSPFDRGAAIAVDAEAAERIAVAAEKAQGVLRCVLVIDADELQPRVLAQVDQQRRLVVARHAPGRPDVDDTDPSLEGGRIEPRHLYTIPDEALQRRQ